MDFTPSLRIASEKPYLEALIDHLLPTGNVLEVGFALGYSAERIQSFHPKHHTIIEPNPEIAKKAIKWAKNNPAITIIQEPWEKALPKLGVFDAIFYNEINLEADLDAGSILVQKGKKLIEKVQSQLPEMMSVKYSDADLDGLLGHSGKSPEVAKFLHELMQNGQISKEQYEKVLAKSGLAKIVAAPTRKKIPDRMLTFLQICLKAHMHKGSRFSCFSTSARSKFEDPDFFEAIITNPHYDYEEKTALIKDKEVLIMVVTCN